MVLTTVPCYWMMSTVITTTTSLFYSIPTLQPLIVDVLIVIMLLYTAVSLIINIV